VESSKRAKNHLITYRSKGHTADKTKKKIKKKKTFATKNLNTCSTPGEKGCQKKKNKQRGTTQKAEHEFETKEEVQGANTSGLKKEQVQREKGQPKVEHMKDDSQGARKREGEQSWVHKTKSH